jgi:hypothetical protein
VAKCEGEDELNKLADFPLEKAGLGDAPDETVIVAWPAWSLTVGDVRKAIAEKQERAYAVAGPMPGTDAWTVAVFTAADAPVGSKVYVEQGDCK